MPTQIFTNADAILGATTVRNITQASHKTGQEHRKVRSSGAAVISLISGKKSVEVSSLTSSDLATLVAIGSSTFCSVGLYVTTTVTIPGQVRLAGGLFASTLAHINLTGSKALVVPTSFEVSQDADFATCALDVHWLSADGLTKACTDSAGNTLAAQSFGSEYAQGPCYINGALVPGVQSFRVTPGIEVLKTPPGSGLFFPTQAFIKNVEPTIQITVNDWEAVVGTVGAFTAMTSCNVYMRKRLDAAVYSVSSDNVRFTFASGLTDTDSVDINNNDDGSATITLHGKTLTASAVVAIP